WRGRRTRGWPRWWAATTWARATSSAAASTTSTPCGPPSSPASASRRPTSPCSPTGAAPRCSRRGPTSGARSRRWSPAPPPGTCSSSTTAATARSSRRDTATAARRRRRSCRPTSTSSRTWTSGSWWTGCRRARASPLCPTRVTAAASSTWRRSRSGPPSAPAPAHRLRLPRAPPGSFPTACSSTTSRPSRACLPPTTSPTTSWRSSSTLSTTPAPAPTPPRPDEGILLSGCQTNETSADVPAYEASGGKACGAFSSAVQSVLAAHPAPLSNRELVEKARAVLEEQGFEQHPCLYCTDANAEAPFLSQDKKEETAVGAASPAMSAALL
uniref:Peptidase C14 caspase domain-containing protein n=1 Tax=Aegilops tauschii subsp. strangulata TaxID=200361 RepID=A0A453KCF2_AEGTS